VQNVYVFWIKCCDKLYIGGMCQRIRVIYTNREIRTLCMYIIVHKRERERERPERNISLKRVQVLL